MSPIELSTNEVHVWCKSLDGASTEMVENAASLLTADEQERAQRFRLPELRTKFVLARAGLRELLARAVGAQPRDLTFAYGEHGKPSLAGNAGAIEFNMSHSGEIAAYAVTVGSPVGIDVEQHRKMQHLEHIARRFFCPPEWEDLMKVPAAERDGVFFNCWVRKEAYMKAVGGGFSIPLHSFRVSLLAAETPALLDVRGRPDEAQEWAMHPFEPAPGYSGAVAIRNRESVVRFHGFGNSGSDV
jgi:4'-phosphopantetheinyl transferase